jgi:hypothetical protein
MVLATSNHQQEPVMGHAIPKQHPAVVLRSHFNLVRALLAAAMVALVGMAIALVIVASDGDRIDSTASQQSAPVMSRQAPMPPDTRYDGGPEEGTRGAIATQAAPDTRYDGGPEEGTRGALTFPATPGSGSDESQGGPGSRTD